MNAVQSQPGLPRMRRGIAARVAWMLLLFGMAFAVLSAGIRLWFDYQQALRAVEESALRLHETHRSSLERSLWNMDRGQLRSELMGMLAIPYLVHVEVSETGEASHRVQLHVGQAGPEAKPFRFDLNSPDGGEALGVLVASFDLQRMRAAVIAGAGSVMWSQLAFTALFLLPVLWLMRRYVTRDLENLAAQLAAFDVSKASGIALKRIVGEQGDEIDQVLAALTAMQLQLRQSYAALERQREQLEHDVEARKRAEAAAEYLAHHDPLTQLPNRRLFTERFEQALQRAVEHGHCGMLVYLDVDHFKHWNDTRGHAFGDAILKTVSTVIGRELPEGAMLARVGGDEFVLLYPTVTRDPESLKPAALAFLNYLRDRLRAPVEILEQSMRITLSMGAVLFPEHGTSASALITSADAAMYHAKLSGRDSICLFAAPMLQEVEQRNALELAVRQALAQHQFDIHYQALVNPDGSLHAAEALLRWRKPDGEMVSPAVFIPVCERSGLMVELGQWVIDAVARQIHDWAHGPGLPTRMRFAINVSALQFALDDFPERLLSSLQRASVEPSRITLELTEGVLIDNLDVVAASIERLHQAGIRIELDDFGTGFSSLAYLRRLAIDGLKIDRSFIADAPFDSRAASVVDAIFDVARRFNLEITAEGVETSAHEAFLSQRNVACLQGYLYTAPLSAAEFSHRYLGPGTAPRWE